MAEQRYQAVLAVLADGLSVKVAAEKVGVSRQTLHSWLARYEAAGFEGLADASHRPRGCPHQMPAPTEAVVLELRRVHRYWGPRRIRHELQRRGLLAGGELPSESAIYRAIVRAGLVEPDRRRRRAERFKRWERAAPMELWSLLVETSEQEQVLDQHAHPLGLILDAAHQAAQRRSAVARWRCRHASASGRCRSPCSGCTAACLPGCRRLR